jgi:diguanylate cyclase (GGDEF)-like protein
MDTFLTVYIFFLAILVVIITGTAIRAFINRQMPGALTFGALMVSMAVWAGCYLLEITHPAPPVKVFARKMLYLGMTLSPPIWLAFALRYTGLGGWWMKSGRIFLLGIPGGIVFLLGITNEYHHLIWESLLPSNSAPAPLTVEYGIGFWFYTIVAYTMILAGIALYVFSYFRQGKALRIKYGVILAGVILTAASNTLFLAFQNGIFIDPTPLSFGLSAPLIAFGFFRFGLSNLFPLAAALVVENLQDAIIVVNSENEITDINRAAGALPGMNSLKQRTPVFSALPQAHQFREIWDSPEKSFHLETKQGETRRTYNVRVIPIVGGVRELLGRVIVFHDITSEQTLLRDEKRRSQHLALLEEAGRRIADSLDSREILQRAVDAITNRFGYAETAISLLTADNMLEVAAISGTEDFGYSPGFRQKYGEGIIGYTASLGQTYISGNVSEDRHYFSSSTRSGSAICTPIFKRGALYGVLYVESVEPNAFGGQDVITLETLASQISESLQRAELYAQTRADLRTITAIQEISKLVAASLDLETISRTVVKSLKDAFNYSHVSIYFLEEEYLSLAAQVGYTEHSAIKKIHISQGVTGRTIRTRTAQFIEDTEKEKVFLSADEKITSEVCVPLLKEDTALGVLNVESGGGNRLTIKDVELLTAIAGPIAISVDNARLHTELKKMATTDAVTGLFNRHVFEQAITAEIERAERKGENLSLIVFDIDYFKEYNDAWGHPAGDARLKAVANIIKVNLRKYDIAARYGGDEFAIILSDCDQKNALQFAQRLRQGTSQGAPQDPKDGEGISGYTLSMGIATYPQDAALPNELLIAADHAAMRAKQHGKNRIKLASDYETA